jgi:hypothetical protein
MSLRSTATQCRRQWGPSNRSCGEIDRKVESLRAKEQIVGLVTIDPLASLPRKG